MNHYKLFLTEKVFPQILLESKILEIGCGSNSLFEDQKFKNVTAIDKSLDCILSAPENSLVNYLAQDITKSFVEKDFDLIVDSHAIHCILDLDHRQLALKNIYQSLKPNGLLASEMMIKKKSSDPYSLFPERLILSSFEVEEELVKNGFKIKYFYISPDLYFLDDVSMKNKCDVLRIIAEKVV